MLRTTLTDLPPNATSIKHTLLGVIVSRIYRRHALPLPSRARMEESYQAQFPSYVVDHPTPDVRRAGVRVISNTHAMVMRVNRDRSVAYHTVATELSLSDALQQAGPSDPYACAFMKLNQSPTPAAYGLRPAHERWLRAVIRDAHPGFGSDLPLACDDDDFDALLSFDLSKLSQKVLQAGDLKVLAFLRRYLISSMRLYNWLVVPDPSGQRRRLQAAEAFPAFAGLLPDLPADAIAKGEPLIPLLVDALSAACPSPFPQRSSPKAAVRHLNHVLHHDLITVTKPSMADTGMFSLTTLAGWQPTAQALLTALPHDRYPHDLTERAAFCAILQQAMTRGLRDPDMAGAIDLMRTAPRGGTRLTPTELTLLAKWQQDVLDTCVITPTLVAQGRATPTAVASLSERLRHRLPFPERLACSRRMFQPFAYATFLRQLEQLKVKPVETDEPWPPLCPPKLYDGYLFVPVTRRLLLQRLGRHQQHCAGDYHQACRAGAAHFVVVVKPDVLPPLEDVAAIDSEALLAQLFSVSARQPHYRFVTCHLTLRPDQVVALSDARGYRNAQPAPHVRGLIQRYLFDLNHDDALHQHRARLFPLPATTVTPDPWPFTLDRAPYLYALAQDYLPHHGPPPESAADWLAAHGIDVGDVVPSFSVIAAE